MEVKIRSRLQSAVRDHVFPGSVVGIVDRTGKRTVIPVGHFTYDTSSVPVRDDTIYDVASITKAIPVSCLVLKLIEERKLSLTDKAITYLPELQKTQYGDAIEIRHLLTMTVDYQVRLSSLKDLAPEELLEAIFSSTFQHMPGERLNYANASSIILGLLIESVAGKPLDVAAAERFFQPLGMNETTFHPETLPRDRIAPTEDDPWRGRIVQGEVHDESAFTLRRKFIPGSAGLFSTVPDLLTFLELLLHNGRYRNIQFFSQSMIEQMATNQLVSLGASTGLGWELHQPRFMGEAASDRTIGKTGFTGCVVMCDITKGRGLVFLSNYHYPKRKVNTEALQSVRRDVANNVFNA